MPKTLDEPMDINLLWMQKIIKQNPLFRVIKNTANLCINFSKVWLITIQAKISPRIEVIKRRKLLGDFLKQRYGHFLREFPGVKMRWFAVGMTRDPLGC